MAIKDLGAVTAYAYAVAGGYTGTEAEFRELLADIPYLKENSENYPDGAYVEEGVAYFTHNGNVLFEITGIGGGGGGGGAASSKLTVTNTSGWLTKTLAEGEKCEVSFEWSSTEDDIVTGPGTLRVTANGSIRLTRGIEQGSAKIDISEYLKSGANVIKVRITDINGNFRDLSYSVSVVALSISSSFDTATVYTSSINFPYTPVGNVLKTVHFILDGNDTTFQTSASGRQLTQTFPAQSHGAHSLKVYFESEINGEIVRSNELYFEFISVVTGKTDVIISSQFNQTTVSQYSTINIPFKVYNPADLSAEVKIFVGEEQVSTQTVDRTEQIFSYRANTMGGLAIKIQSGSTVRTFNLTVTESEIDAEAETENLALYLSSHGRSNNEEHPDTWTYNDISAVFSGFNWTSDGWVLDSDGIPVLRVAGNARVTIPYQIFKTDFKGTGKTIEIDFTTRNVLDYDSVIFSCMSGGKGLSLTAQKATLKSEQSEISMQYKEEDHIRLTFVCEKRSENRLLMVYVNGIPSGVVQYPTDDFFSQTTPVDISIGSNDCTIDLYCIRVYDNNLTKNQILDNWIADTQNSTLMYDRYIRNNVYDEYGNIIIANLPSDLPYMILTAEQLPQYKGDKKVITGSYTDPKNPGKSFTFEGCQINVQGTSSAPYARKNYDMQFKKGFEMNNGSHADNYALASTVVPFNRFVIKADVASSEGANNVELVKLFCDINPFRSQEEQENPLVRQGIYGFPIVVFWNNPTTGTTSFLGKYNFNLPKRAPGPYGYSGDMESWEFQNNTSNLMLFKSDYFSMAPVTDPTTGETKEAWRYDYEARFPEDTWTNIDKLQEFQSFIYSTYRENATGNALDTPVTYTETHVVYDEVVDPETGKISYVERLVTEDVTYSTDTAAYRLARFKNEFPTYADLDSFIFYYIFTELFLMVDSRAKNLFIGFNGPAVTASGRKADRKAVAQPYDMDTGLGTNNEGSLVFSYGLEDTDKLSGASIFNGQDSVLWCNLRDSYKTEITRMYQTLRSGGILSYSEVERRFEEHQSKWPEAIWIEDSWFKYIDPLISPDPGKEATAVYLPMMQGSKEEQRKWWLINRFKYMDSKWTAGDALSQRIQLRGYAKANITVTPYADIYPTVQYGSYVVSERGQHGQATTLVCPIDALNDTEIYIYSAPQIASVGDLSGLKVGFADFSAATRLQNIKLGDSSNSYENPNLTTLTLGSNRLLKTLDVRNCTGLQTTVDLSGCEIIEEVYFENTKIPGVTLPNGGVLRTLHLPNTITNLTIRNQTALTDLTVAGYSNISTLRLENLPGVDTKAILNALSDGTQVRLINFYWEATDATEIEALLAKLDKMTGIDEALQPTAKAQVSGTIHTGSLTGAQIASYNERYPYLRVRADHTSCQLRYYSYDGSSLLNEETVLDGGNGTWAGTPARASTAQYTFTFVGWSTTKDASSKDDNATKNVSSDRDIYAAYSRETRKYTATFVKASDDGGGTLYTQQNVPYGTTPTYGGATPTTSKGTAEDYPFEGWNPPLAGITGNTTYTAVFGSPAEVAEITDDWDTILTAIDDGTYKTKYKVGNYKPLDLGTQGAINMQIAAFDTDVMANGNTVPTTWISMGLMATSKRWNPSLAGGSGARTSGTGAIGGYENSELNAYMHSTILPLIPANIAGQIKAVSKSHNAYNPNETAFLQTSNLSVWVPSMWEMFGKAAGLETSGIRYGILYKDNASRTKMKPGATSGTFWWLRSTSGMNGINGVTSKGADSTDTAQTAYGVPLCFCLGTKEIDDSWAEIKAACNDGSYKTKYSVGQYKNLDLGNEGVMKMEIVGIDADDKADGSGKAPLTFISKGLLETTHRWNPKISGDTGAYTEGTGTIGGYEKSEIRTYLENDIWNKIPSDVRAIITPVTKKHNAYFADNSHATQTLTLSVWLPSQKEISNKEEDGADGGVWYSEVYKDNASRIKMKPNAASGIDWWSRTAYSSSNARYVDAAGNVNSSSVNSPRYVPLGFCF